MEEYDFKGVHALIDYAVLCCPARMKSIDLHSQDHKAGRPQADFLWSQALAVINSAVGAANITQRTAFWLRYLGEPAKRLHISEIAAKLGRSERQVRRYINDILDDIERAAVAKEMIPEPDLSVN